MSSDVVPIPTDTERWCWRYFGISRSSHRLLPIAGGIDPSRQSSRCGDRYCTPVSFRRSRRSIHQFRLLEPIMCCSLRLFRPKLFRHRANERRQLALRQVRLLVVNRTGEQWVFVHGIPHFRVLTQSRFSEMALPFDSEELNPYASMSSRPAAIGPSPLLSGNRHRLMFDMPMPRKMTKKWAHRARIRMQLGA